MFGPTVFATWEEAELMEVPMVTAAGTRDVRSLGVEPKRMVEVLGLTRGYPGRAAAEVEPFYLSLTPVAGTSLST